MSAHPLLGQDIMKALPQLRQAGIAGLVDDKLHPDDMPGGAQVSVFYDDMLRGDQVELRWVTSSPNGSHIDALPVEADGQPLPFIVPYAVLDAGRGLEATLGYTSTRSGVTRQAYARLIEIMATPSVSFPVSKVTLSGRMAIVAFPLTGRDVAGNTQVVTAQGGQAPYTYSSNDPRVATVDAASGKVAGQRNGTTTIVAQDSAGNRATYEVDVSNIWEIKNSSSGNFATAQSFYGATQLRSPDLFFDCLNSRYNFASLGAGYLWTHQINTPTLSFALTSRGAASLVYQPLLQSTIAPIWGFGPANL